MEIRSSPCEETNSIRDTGISINHFVPGQQLIERKNSILADRKNPVSRQQLHGLAIHE